MTNYSESENVGNNLGGIAGRISKGGKVMYCYNNGIINGTNALGSAGGIIGGIDSNNKAVYVTNCYNLASVTGRKVSAYRIGGIIAHIDGTSSGQVYLTNLYNKGSISNGGYIGGICGDMTYITLEGEFFNYGSVANYYHQIGAISGRTENQQVSNEIKRAYGGNCSSSLNTNGGGSNNSYEENLIMPTVYSIVNAQNTGEFTASGTNENAPKLKNIE